MKVAEVRIKLSDAVRSQRAESWLKMGQPMQALLELQGLCDQARRHPRAAQVFISVVDTAEKLTNGVGA